MERRQSETAKTLQEILEVVVKYGEDPDMGKRTLQPGGTNPSIVHEKKLPTRQVVVIAAYMIGGSDSAVETEDIAVKANEIAPGRFNWRKYPGQVNLESVRKRLSDASKPVTGKLLIGSDRNGWLLTTAGIEFAKDHVGAISKEASRPFSLSERAFLRAERDRLRETDAYRKFYQKKPDQITKREAETFFRIDDYVIGDFRTKKVRRLVDAFSADVEIGSLVSRLAVMVENK